MSYAVILNPHAKANRDVDRAVRELSTALHGRGHVYVTSTIADIEQALRQADARGEHRVMIAGGDGSAHWVVNESIRIWGIQEVHNRFVFIPSWNGGINFLAHALGETSPAVRVLERVLRTDDPERLRTVDVHMLRVEGSTLQNGDKVPFVRYAWAAALAGYGANFFPPWYQEKTSNMQWRMSKILAKALGSVAVDGMLNGIGVDARPMWLRNNEHTFLRPFSGELLVDEMPYRDAEGRIPSHFTVAHAGSIPVNLGGLIKVFGQSDAEHIHIHVGDLRPRAVPRVLLQALRGHSLTAPGLYDGPAHSMTLVARNGDTLTPALDGEIMEQVVEVSVTPGGCVRFYAGGGTR